jgi:Protein of unknown function (DUF1177)
MLMHEIITAWDWIDRPDASGQRIAGYFAEHLSVTPEVTRLQDGNYNTEVIKWVIPGSSGKSAGGTAPTLAISGRLGGVGARPRYTGTVSDADGAVVAIATALKLSNAIQLGEPTAGDVHITTHICPAAPVRDIPVRGQMNSPVPAELLLRYEAPASADALLSVDTTRGHRIINHTGIAITPTLVDGYLLRVSDDLLTTYTDVTNELPNVLPITMQDIMPSDAGIYRINSIMAPGNVFDGPVVGLATVSEGLVFGTATSAAPPATLETAARFCVEVARRYGEGRISFYDVEEHGRILERFGRMRHLVGKE